MRLDLGLSESEEMLKKTALDFISREAPKSVIRALEDSDTGYSEELWRKIVDMGWLGIIIPEKYGGYENSLTSAGVLYEALGTGPLPGPCFSSGILSSLIILEAGTEEQKQRILPNIAQGKQIVALALTEPEYGWELETIQTKAAEKKGYAVLTGTKLFTLDAGAASHFIVVARTEKGISLFLVDRKSPGISLRRLPGFFAGQAFELKLDGVKVPWSDLLGVKDEGWTPLENAINKSIPVLCAYKVGGCQAVVEMSIEYSQIRIQFGQAIGRFQRVQDMIIDMVNRADAARWTTYEALWKLDTQRPAAESVHLAKAVTSEAYWEVCTLAHRVFSGISYSKEHALTLHTRASRYLYSFLGDPAYHRQQLANLLTA